MHDPDISRLRWDDVRIFLATMRATSLREASEELGVSRPTVGRRIDALEQRLRVRLFERRSDGLHATPEAVQLQQRASEVERSMLALARAAHAADSQIAGPVRVTLPDAVASELLMPDFAAFAEKWPQIELFFLPNYGISSLADGAADVAIRFMPHGVAPQADLAGRLAATAYVAAYGSGDRWIGQRGPTKDTAFFERTSFSDLPIWGAMPNAGMQRAAAIAGMGRVLLPCFYAEPTLERQSEPMPGFDIWVLVHPDLRRTPRLRVFRDAVVEALRRKRPRLEGRHDAGI